MSTASTRTLANRELWLWGFRLVWVVLPLLAGPLFADALNPTEPGFRRAVSIGLWVLWAVGLLAALLPHPFTLTPVRLIATGAVPAAIWAAAAGPTNGWAAIGVLAIMVAAGVSLLPHIAAVFVDGESYGDERRLPLRPPRAVLMGPLPLTWLAAVVGFCAGPLLLADGRWLLGALITVTGFAMAAAASRSLHTLTRRFLVFVPTGMVLHDLTVLTDPVLFRREDIQVLGPAFTDSVATDLTLGGSGLALEARFTRALSVPVRTPRPKGTTRADVLPPSESEDLRAVLVTPSQPGEVLAEATRRRIRVG